MGRDRRLLVTLLVAVSAIAWFVLWHWGHSPYLHYVHHAHQHEPPSDSGLVAAMIFVSGWTLMTVAMMLPTSIPLISIFSTVARERQDRTLLVALVVAGYLARRGRLSAHSPTPARSRSAS